MNLWSKWYSSLGFASSKWIWAARSIPNVAHALRKYFTPPSGKALVAAEILIAADNHLTQGEYLGPEVKGQVLVDPEGVHYYCIWVHSHSEDIPEVFKAYVSQKPATLCNFEYNGGSFLSRVDHVRGGSAEVLLKKYLLPSYNVFTVNASTSHPSDGTIIASILLTYSDGTTDTIVLDSSWQVSNTVPTGFEQLSFDDTAWPVATTAGAYGSGWVWTDAMPARGLIPAGQQAFRQTFEIAPGKVPTPIVVIPLPKSDALMLACFMEVPRVRLQNSGGKVYNVHP
ncbi:hypothetical protein B0H10DRAFT_1948958 [Mycena sp. CBHHK59/15]|nr:hypothetical protein B0H10DRAFT_1948958 [Mycena sp. CBHHK59/15]